MDAATYDRWYETPRGQWIGQREVALVLDCLQPRPGESLLDVGCGTGYFTRAIADAIDGKAAAVDIKPEWVAYARGRDSGRSSYTVADARALPYPDGCFDLVVSILSLCFIVDEISGAREILLGNMQKLNLAPSAIDTVFISHAHWDHTGGLESFLRVHAIPVVVPAFCPVPRHASDVIRVTGSMKIGDGLFSTGLLGGIEQSLVIQMNEQAVVIVGCSHPGVETILAGASAIGNVRVLVGGLHGFDAFHPIEDLDYVCPAHCTRYIQEIQHRYPEKYIAAGVGKVIALRNRSGSHIVAY